MSDPIALIGGGAAAVSILKTFSIEHPSQKILWICPEQNKGLGNAYRTKDPLHLLNVPASKMSLIQTNLEDFVNFLGNTKEATEYLPRATYAEYIQNSISQLNNFEHWSTKALQIKKESAYWTIQGADGFQRAASKLILALGSLPPRRLPQAADSVVYRVDIWDWLEEETTSPLRNVWIIGSGLTAVDLSLSILSKHPHAQIHLLSRHGQLPRVHAQGSPTGFNANIDGVKKAQTLLQKLKRFRESNLAVADLRPYTVELWQSLSAQEKKQFLRHLQWIWEVNRHRMSPNVGEQISFLLNQQKLHVHAGRVISATALGELIWKARGTDKVSIEKPDLILQACGPSTRIDNPVDKNPLFQTLLHDQTFATDELNLGLKAKTDGTLQNSDGATINGVRIIGALARGSLWECTAMPEIRKMAFEIAKTI